MKIRFPLQFSFCFMCLCALTACGKQEKYSYKHHDGQRIEILYEPYSDDNDLPENRLYYHIPSGINDSTDTHTIVSAIGALDHEPWVFKSIHHKKSDVVAIVEASQPHIILVIHNFATGQTYPAGTGHETSNALSQIGHTLITDIPPSTNGEDYVLGYEARPSDLK